MDGIIVLNNRGDLTMKRLLSILVLASLVLMVFCGCEKEGVRKVKVEMTPFNGGKLVIDGYSLNWSEGDGIAVQEGSRF